MSEEFIWTQDGEVGGAPAWRGICGDYEAIVNRMHPDGYGPNAGLWNWLVNNRGHMGLQSADEAKAAATNALRVRLRIRVCEAKDTMKAFPHLFDAPPSSAEGE